MKEIPVLQSNAKIEPGPIAESSGAYANLGKGWEIFSSVGAKIAQKQANTMAEMQGYEAGKNPGEKQLPALNEVGEHYQAAYNKQASQVILTKADRLLNDYSLQFKSLRNPTGDDLLRYEENLNKAIPQMVELSPPSMRGEIEYRINQKYNTLIAKAAESVFKADQIRQQESFDNYILAESRNMLEYIDTDERDKADSSYEAIRQALETNRQSIGEAAYFEGITLLKATKDYAEANYQRKQAYAQGGEQAEADFILNYNNKKQKDMTEAEKKSIVDGLIKAHAEDVKVRRIAQDLAYSDARTEMLALDGNVPPERWREYKDKTSSSQFNDLQELYMRLQADNVKASRLIAAISQDLNDPVAMSKYGGKELDLYFDAMSRKQEQILASQGKDNTNPLLMQANIANSVPAKIPKYVNMLETAVKYGGRDQARDAAAAITTLAITNPAAIEGIDKEVMATANLFDSIRTNTPKEDWQAIEDARKSTFKLTPEVKAERLAYAEQVMNKNHGGKGTYNTSNKILRDKIEGVMGGKRIFSKNVVIPDGMVNQFRTLLPGQLMITPNEDQAFKEIANQLNQTYDITRTNNRDEFMRNAPERAAQKQNVGYFLNNSKAYALHKFVEENKALNANPDAFVMDKIEWPDDPFAGKDIESLDLIRQPYYKGNPKILVNGIEQEVVIKSDALTSQGKQLSWAFYGKKDILETPLNSPTEYGGVGRWHLDEDLFNRQIEQIPEKLLEEAIKLKQISDFEIGPELLESDAYWLLQGKKDK